LFNFNGLTSFVLASPTGPFHIHNHDVNWEALRMAVAITALKRGKPVTGKNA
jgi:hypothetical protein